MNEEPARRDHVTAGRFAFGGRRLVPWPVRPKLGTLKGTCRRRRELGSGHLPNWECWEGACRRIRDAVQDRSEFMATGSRSSREHNDGPDRGASSRLAGASPETHVRRLPSYAP